MEISFITTRFLPKFKFSPFFFKKVVIYDMKITCDLSYIQIYVGKFTREQLKLNKSANSLDQPSSRIYNLNHSPESSFQDWICYT